MVGLSLRTIRYYEEIGLVAPSGRTEGGFRLYTDADIERLHLVKALKPIGMSLETMGRLLEAVDRVAGRDGRQTPAAESKLDEVLTVAIERCDELQERLERARAAIERLSAVKTR